MAKRYNIDSLCEIGTQFGWLKTVALPYRKHDGHYLRYYVRAVCNCGVDKEYRLYELQRKRVVSCGCYCKQLNHGKTHGLKNHSLYVVWTNMKRRCLNPKVPSYKNYGARGILVCQEWVNSFQTFYDWCMANGWKKGLTIERENNDGNYEPANCIIATMTVQARNRRNNKLSLQKAITIRNLHKMGAFTSVELSSIYNVANNTINCILNNKIWAI